MHRILTLLLLVLFASDVSAAAKYKINGRLTSASAADSVLLLSKAGVKRAAISGAKFSLSKLSAANLKNSKLYFFKDGAPVGPAVLKQSKGSKYLTFSGKSPVDKNSLNLTLALDVGFLRATKKVDAKWIAKSKVADANFTGASLGYPGASGSSLRQRAVNILEEGSPDSNTDSDADGVPDALDIDDDNDGIPDDRDSGGGNMISSLYLNFADTLNAHRGNLNPGSISDMLSAENVFGLTFFIGIEADFPSATGGHVVCDTSQPICRSAADGGSSSYYTGVSESDHSVTGQVWSNYNADGSGKPNLEPITLNGGSHPVLVAAIQPRTSSFSAGELIIANITNGATVLGTRIFSVLPPVISSPMLSSYDAGSGTLEVDYDSLGSVGSSSGTPIVMNGNTLTLNFYPPQRNSIPGVESDGAYRDIGNSSIGALIGGEGVSTEFTCAGLYSELSAGITELPASESMPGGHIEPSNGAVLWPLFDATADVATEIGTPKSFKVDLASCISRAGLAPGTYMLTLTYAGTSTSFGAPRSAQIIHVSIPAVS